MDWFGMIDRPDVSSVAAKTALAGTTVHKAEDPADPTAHKAAGGPGGCLEGACSGTRLDRHCDGPLG
jgi:hypothetical protein